MPLDLLQGNGPMDLKRLDPKYLASLLLLALVVMLIAGMSISRLVTSHHVAQPSLSYGQDDSPRARAFRAMTRELR